MKSLICLNKRFSRINVFNIISVERSVSVTILQHNSDTDRIVTRLFQARLTSYLFGRFWIFTERLYQETKNTIK